jgi:hypothetical protein
MFVPSTAAISGAAYLKADAARVARWRKRLADVPGLKVGIAWQGNRDYSMDRWRSIPLAEFAPLANVPGVSLISLQKGFGSEQLAAFRETWPVVDLAIELDNEGGAFLDTAAAMRSLDLVITSDTGVAHLAGALGRPVWVLVPSVAEWRYRQAGEDMVWYPSARLLRAPHSGPWDQVLREAIRSLTALTGMEEANRGLDVTKNVTH